MITLELEGQVLFLFLPLPAVIWLFSHSSGRKLEVSGRSRCSSQKREAGVGKAALSLHWEVREEEASEVAGAGRGGHLSERASASPVC